MPFSGKDVYNDPPWDPTKVVIVQRSFLLYKRSNWDLKVVAVMDRFRHSEGVITSGLRVSRKLN